MQKGSTDMNFQEMYRQKLTTPEEAVKVIRSGDWVDYGWSTGTPDVLDKALAARAEETVRDWSAAAEDPGRHPAAPSRHRGRAQRQGSLHLQFLAFLCH